MKHDDPRLLKATQRFDAIMRNVTVGAGMLLIGGLALYVPAIVRVLPG